MQIVMNRPIMLNDIMLSGIMLSVIMLNVVTLKNWHDYQIHCLTYSFSKGTFRPECSRDEFCLDKWMETCIHSLPSHILSDENVKVKILRQLNSKDWIPTDRIAST